MKQSLDLSNEKAITLAEVPNHLPKRNGKKAHYSTVYRWVSKGVRGKRLASVLVGGVRYTTVEAVERFLDAPVSSGSDSNPIRSMLQGDLDAVSRALDDAGV